MKKILKFIFLVEYLVAFLLVINVSSSFSGSTSLFISCVTLFKLSFFKIYFIRLFLLTGSVFPAAGLVMLAYLGCDPILFIAMLCLTTGFDGFRGSSSGVNIIDISPNYAGAVMGVVNSAGNVTGFVAPYVVGLLLSAAVSC